MNWDGSYIGQIENIIKSYEIIDKYVKVNFENVSAYAFKYENKIPLIADEIKPLFGLVKIGRHHALWGTKDVLLCKIEGVEMSVDTSSDIQIEEIQRSYVFRLVLGFSSYGDDILRVRKYRSGVKTVTSYIESEYTYEPKHKYCSKITKSVISKWFYDVTIVDKLIKSMFKREELPILRNKIDEIIKRIDPSQILWVTCLIFRIQSYLD